MLIPELMFQVHDPGVKGGGDVRHDEEHGDAGDGDHHHDAVDVEAAETRPQHSHPPGIIFSGL